MAENKTETVSMMINEIRRTSSEDRADKVPKINVNDNEDLEGLINYTESAHIESEWTVEDGFMTAPVSFCSATVCNNTLKTWDEIKKTWQMWEGRPITFEHPDQMVVKNPTDIIGFLGNVEKDEENKRLKGELYVMQEPAEFNHQDKNYWKTMLEALKDRKEISIGYWAVPENEDGTYTDEFGNELEYDETVTQILPDHIASVDKGACSPEQGCGIGVEKNIEEDDRMSLLSKIHEKLKTLIEKEDTDPKEEEVKDMEKVPKIERNEDGSYRIIEETDSMNEEEKSEENETDEKRSEQSESCDHDEVIQEIRRTTSEDPEESKIPRIEGCNPEDRQDVILEKQETIEELRKQVETLKNELNEYRQKEIDRLRERAEELTELTEEQLEDKERYELEALIEGASNARMNEPTEKKEAGKNLRSPPGSNDSDEGPEVIDLYEDPLDPQ